MADFALQWFGKYLTDGTSLVQVVSVGVTVLFCENCADPEGAKTRIFVNDIEGYGTSKKWRVVVADDESELMAA